MQEVSKLKQELDGGASSPAASGSSALMDNDLVDELRLILAYLTYEVVREAA
jgi:hypothetical protein